MYRRRDAWNHIWLGVPNESYIITNTIPPSPLSRTIGHTFIKSNGWKATGTWFSTLIRNNSLNYIWYRGQCSSCHRFMDYSKQKSYISTWPTLRMVNLNIKLITKRSISWCFALTLPTIFITLRKIAWNFLGKLPKTQGFGSREELRRGDKLACNWRYFYPQFSFRPSAMKHWYVRFQYVVPTLLKVLSFTGKKW